MENVTTFVDDLFGSLGISTDLLLLILILLVLILMIIVLALQVKVSYIRSRYDLFMRGRDGATLEDNIVEIYRKLQVIQNKDMANKDVIKVLNRGITTTIQKTGLVKYNAFDGMGGQSSFALTLLNMDNTGYILNAMHSRNSCYLYIKEITRGEPEKPLSKEEQLSLDRAMEKKDRLI